MSSRNPIETAPRDGTWIFVYAPGYETPMPARWGLLNSDPRPVEDGTDHWRYGWEGHGYCFPDVTHWAPIPDSLSTQEKTLGTDEAAAAPQWAVVELMGHVRLVGILTEESKFGATMGRIDVLQRDFSTITQWFSGGSVYRVTLTDEASARQMVALTVVPPKAFSMSTFDDEDDE